MKRSSHLSEFDVTKRQQQTLNYILDQESKVKKDAASVPKVSVADARAGASQYEVTSDRTATRLLFISKDISLLNQTTQSLDGYLNLSDVFDEVHILILQVGIKNRNPVLRVAPNVWLYVASAATWFEMLSTAKNMIKDQMEFADGFRADLIVARDPLESGLIALWASARYKRPVQLHVLEDFSQLKTFKKYTYPRLMSYVFRYVCRRAVSIRTSTDLVKNKLEKMLPQVKDIATLPRFYNIAALAEGQSYLNIKDKYKQFAFIILYVGSLDHGSRAFQAIDASRNLMRSPKVGLVVIGDGEARSEFITRANVLGIPTQVVFEKNTDDLYSYLKSADVLIVPDLDEASDELAIKGAAAGIPLVLGETQLRQDIFTADRSALFFHDNDVAEMSNQLKKVLNDPGMRIDLVTKAQLAIEEKLHEDPLNYKVEYRDSVEDALFPEENN